MLAYAVAVGEDNSALDSRNRGWSGENENTVSMKMLPCQKGFRLSSWRIVKKTAPIRVDSRFSDSSRAPAEINADEFRRLKTDWRAQEISTVYYLGFQGSTGAVKCFIFNSKGILTHKVLGRLSSCFFHALVCFRETHTVLFFFLLWCY